MKKASSGGVGIIGYGSSSSARTFHVPLIGAEPRLKMEVVCTSARSLDQAKTLLPGVPVVTDMQRVLDNPEVQMVVVAVPNALHYEFARRALMAGKHVVVEKPLAITVAEVDELMALARNNGLLLTQFHNRRWDGGFLTVKKLLAEGRVGKPVAYESYYDRFVPEVPDNWREHGQPGSGVLYDLGVHLIDQAFALFGRPMAVTAVIRSLREGARADDYFRLELDYGQMQCLLGANMLAAAPGPRYKLSGSKGAFVKYGVDYQAISLNEGQRPGDPGWGEDKPVEYGYFSDGSHREAIVTELGAYQEFYRGIAAAVLDGKPLPVPVADARDIIALIEAGVRSNTEGRRIEAGEIGFL